MAMTITVLVFWIMKSCRCFGGTFSLHHQGIRVLLNVRHHLHAVITHKNTPPTCCHHSQEHSLNIFLLMWFLILLLMQYPEVRNIKYLHKEMEKELAIDLHQSLS